MLQGDVFLVLGRHQEHGTDNVKGCHMYGHDPLLILLIMVLLAVLAGWIQHRWPTIGASVDVAGKVLLAIIGLMLFIVTATGTTTTTPQPASPAPATPAPATSAPAAPAPSGTAATDEPGAPRR